MVLKCQVVLSYNFVKSPNRSRDTKSTLRSFESICVTRLCNISQIDVSMCWTSMLRLQTIYDEMNSLLIAAGWLYCTLRSLNDVLNFLC